MSASLANDQGWAQGKKKKHLKSGYSATIAEEKTIFFKKKKKKENNPEFSLKSEVSHPCNDKLPCAYVGSKTRA